MEAIKRCHENIMFLWFTKPCCYLRQRCQHVCNAEVSIVIISQGSMGICCDESRWSTGQAVYAHGHS